MKKEEIKDAFLQYVATKSGLSTEQILAQRSIGIAFSILGFLCHHNLIKIDNPPTLHIPPPTPEPTDGEKIKKKP